MSRHRRTLCIESGVAAAVIVVAARFTWPADLGLSHLAFHPAWVAIILLAARYGPRGLFSSLVIVSVPLVGIAFLRTGSEEFLYQRLRERADLLPLFSATAVAWVGMSHESRLLRVSRQLEESRRVYHRAEEWAKALHSSLDYLRSRCDRIDASVNLWRRVARSLEHGDLTQAARAALELCTIRLAATAGCVERLDGSDRWIAARRGVWRADSRRPRDLAADETVRGALRSGKIQVAVDLPHATEADSDVAVPVLQETDHEILGVIALRGVDPARLRASEFRDLALIAEWLSPAMVRQSDAPKLRALHGGRAG